MIVMGGCVVLGRGVLVTGSAQRVVGPVDAGRVDVVAVRAANSLVIHFALEKGPVHIHFIPDLAVGVVGLGREEFILETVVVPVPQRISFADDAAP